jgi:hypothetical protein
MVEDVSAPRLIETSPPPADVPDEPTAVPPEPAAAGRVPLPRLLTGVTLSPAEASLVSVRLLESVHASRARDGSLYDDDRWTAALTRSGDVEVTRVEGNAGVPLDELLAQLSSNARRLPAHPAPAQLVLLRRLEELAAEPGLEPGARAARLEAGLVEVLGPSAARRLGAQLADLVSAAAHLEVTTRAPLAVASPAVAMRPRSRTPWRRRSAGRRRLPARRAVAIALLLVAVSAGSGYVLTRRTGDASAGAEGRDPSTAAPSGEARSRSSSEPAGRASTRPRFATLAPRQAGAVTGLELRPVAACDTGAPCPVTVTVRLRPAPDVRVVTWRVGTATSCDGDLSWSPPVDVGAQPGWTSVYATTAVPIPERRPVVLVAATTTPARAQSPPVPVAGSSPSC